MTAETPTFLDADTEPPGPAPDAAPEKAGRVDQVPAQRHAAILEFVRLHGAVSVQDLAESLGASRSTVRRDLDYLSTHNYLERTHGGAQLPLAQRASPEVDSAISTHIAQRQKAAIGRAAARMVQPGQTVILDSGTTVLETARALAGLGIAFRAITNDLAIAQVLGAASGVSVIVAGGTLRPGSPTLLGSIGISLLRDVHADLTLLGAHAVTGQTVTDSSLELIDIKRAMIAAAARTVALIDSSKFGPPSNFTICEMDRVADLVSDTGLAAEAREALRPCGTQVTLVEPA